MKDAMHRSVRLAIILDAPAGFYSTVTRGLDGVEVGGL